MRNPGTNAIFTGFLSLLLCLMVVPAAAQDAGDIKESMEHARDEARESTETLNEFMSDPSKSIPRALLRRAEAIAVFTNIKKGGFIIGGTGGDGVISRRTGNSWSLPAFYDVGGADVGFQIGAKQTDYILVFMTPTALKDLLDDEVELSAGLGIAAGPVGDTAAVTTGKVDNVYVYSNSGGAFAGATIGGGSIKANNSINEAIYKMKAGAFLRDPKQAKTSGLPSELRNFSNTIAKYAK